MLALVRGGGWPLLGLGLGGGNSGLGLWPLGITSSRTGPSQVGSRHVKSRGSRDELPALFVMDDSRCRRSTDVTECRGQKRTSR